MNFIPYHNNNRYIVHALVKSKDFVLITICSNEFQNRRAFSFLNRLSENPQRPNLVSLTKEFNKNQDDDKILAAQQSLESVKKQVYNNIDKALDNSGQLDFLIQSTDDLKISSNLYRVSTNKLKRKVWTRNLIIILIIVSIIFGIASIIFMFVWFLCGFPNWSCVTRNSK